MNARNIPAALTALALSVSCSDPVTDARPFRADGKLEWMTVMPSNLGSALWLRYKLESPVIRDKPEDEGFLAYDFTGRLRIEVDGNAFYHGALILKPSGPALDKFYAPEIREEVEKICTYSSCKESGLTKLQPLRDLQPGAAINIEATMPMTYGKALIHSLEMQMRRE